MRLAFPVLLVTLAFFCYEANAGVCPAVLGELGNLIIGPKFIFEISLQQFNPPPEALQDALEAKECIDGFSIQEKLRLMSILTKMTLSC
ncbi:PREDICTED: secretoglobin family 1D member-like [Hipposideros armiger]|uniref:Uteroglobin n=1 Tax=Hipposideros armiger TaxID=186990 RepID=A0A8B7QMG8_HIPAR|nr:PREDICTED: secretoglobin family 1D member-like [Hipposideros armiger]